MNQYLEFIQQLKSCIPEEIIFIEEPMEHHTNFKLGGPADILVIPNDKDELETVLALSRQKNIPCFIIGNGSNLIVRDGGIRGLVIKLDHLKEIRVDGEYITAETGAELKELSDIAMENSLTGLEFACGIPGSLGGAVFMNAGAYDGEMSYVLESVLVITPQGEILELTKDELELGYRTSSVKKHGHVVMEARLKLTHGERERIHEKILDLTKRREDKQPLEYPSAGSTFKRPEGYYAGKLIQDAGLKGYQIRGAQVSEKHCGFVINKDHAKARDVLELIAYIQSVVLEKFGIQLETEVLVVGEDETDEAVLETPVDELKEKKEQNEINQHNSATELGLDDFSDSMAE